MRTPVLALVLVAAAFGSADAKLRVVATTSDLAALAREVGGEFVEADSIAKGYQDPHFVETKPSYLLKLKRADLFVQVGLELEVGWAPSLLTNCRNPKILPGNPGFLDASQGIDVMEKPQGPVDRSLGDVHPLGNPHFWLHPDNGRGIARLIAGRLKELDPANAREFESNLARFEGRLAKKEKEWLGKAAALNGLRVVTYHNSWSYFAGFLGLNVVSFVEPRPGIPPSPAHVQELIARMRREKTPLLIMEPYFDDKLPAKIAREAGSRLVVLAPSVGAEKGVDDYFGLFDRAIGKLSEASALEVPQP